MAKKPLRWPFKAKFFNFFDFFDHFLTENGQNGKNRVKKCPFWAIFRRKKILRKFFTIWSLSGQKDQKWPILCQKKGKKIQFFFGFWTPKRLKTAKSKGRLKKGAKWTRSRSRRIVVPRVFFRVIEGPKGFKKRSRLISFNSPPISRYSQKNWVFDPKNAKMGQFVPKRRHISG